MTDRERIRGKVARVLTARELVLNIGSNDGVQVGMHFDVLDAASQNITDPDTGVTLGSIYRPKVRVKVSQVQAALCVAVTFRTKKERVGGGAGGVDLAYLLEPGHVVERYETLAKRDKPWEELSEGESYVKIGDPVVEVADIASTAEQ